jgi:hypothetical protein
LRLRLLNRQKNFGDADFSPEAIEKREKQGHAQALKALAAPPQDPSSVLNGGAG